MTMPTLDPVALLTDRDGEVPEWVTRSDYGPYMTHDGRPGYRIRVFGFLRADGALGDLSWLYEEHDLPALVRSRLRLRAGKEPATYFDIRFPDMTTATTTKDEGVQR